MSDMPKIPEHAKMRAFHGGYPDEPIGTQIDPEHPNVRITTAGTPAPRREDAAGERERLEQLLYEHVRDRDEEAVELRIAFGIVPDMRDLKTQLLERAAALSTAERERDELRQQLGSAIDVARETMTEITTGRLASIGGIENTYCPQISVSRIKKLHERLVALADSYRARVPSGGEEGRS